MNVKRFFTLTVWLLGLGLVVGLGTAVSQQAPPAENKGMRAPVVASLDLGPEIDGMQGRQLRMRLITLEPGGVIALHSHKDRPTVVHLLHGTLTELREGGYLKEYREGESWAEGKTITHWAENRGANPAVAIVVDIFRQP